MLLLVTPEFGLGPGDLVLDVVQDDVFERLFRAGIEAGAPLGTLIVYASLRPLGQKAHVQAGFRQTAHQRLVGSDQGQR